MEKLETFSGSGTRLCLRPTDGANVGDWIQRIRQVASWNLQMPNGSSVSRNVIKHQLFGNIRFSPESIAINLAIICSSW